jgi:predicted PurR-regulated permease PerM
MTNHKRLQIVTFLLFLLVMLGLVFSIVRPFLSMLVLAFILAVLFRPLYDRFHRLIKSESGAALATVGVMILILVLPFVFLGQVLFSEISNLIANFKNGGLVLSRAQLVSGLPLQLQAFIETITRDLNQIASTLTANAFQTFSRLLSNLATFVLALFMTFFAAYYFLKDGEHFKQVLMDISPIDDNQEKILFSKISNAINGVVKGQFLTAVVQGLVATTGFLIFGVPNPFLWGFFTILAALVPTVGTSLAVLPAVALLLLTGHFGAGIGLAIWGALAVGLIDNFIGPKLVGRTTRVHPLLVLISVLGGVMLFGFIGFLLGPILMAVFIAMVEMYRTDFQKYLDK